MPNPRWKKLAPEKKTRILEAAARAFAEHGLEGASINRILADSGMSKGAAYYYFEDKADLFSTVSMHCWEEFMKHASFSTAGLTRKTFWPRVEELMRHACEHMACDPVMTMMAKAVWHMDTHQHTCPVMDNVAAFSRAWMGDVVHKGQALGVVRRDLPAELLIAISAAVDQANDRWWVENAGRLPAEKLTEISMQVFAGIRDLLTKRAR